MLFKEEFFLSLKTISVDPFFHFDPSKQSLGETLNRFKSPSKPSSDSSIKMWLPIELELVRLQAPGFDRSRSIAPGEQTVEERDRSRANQRAGHHMED